MEPRDPRRGPLGAQIPDPARLGIDVIFPAAMVGLAVGLITGRRELVAAIVGAAVAVAVALVSSPSVGIVTGGVIGPLVGLLVPGDRPRIGTARDRQSAEHYGTPDALHGPPDRPDSETSGPR